MQANLSNNNLSSLNKSISQILNQKLGKYVMTIYYHDIYYNQVLKPHQMSYTGYLMK